MHQLARVLRSDPLAPHVISAVVYNGLIPEIAHETASHTAKTVDFREPTFRHLALAAHQARFNVASINKAHVDCAHQVIASRLQTPHSLTRLLTHTRMQLNSYINYAPPPPARARSTWKIIRSNRSLSREFDLHMVRRSTTSSLIPRHFSQPLTCPLVVDVAGGPGQYLAATLLQLGKPWRGLLVDDYFDAGWWSAEDDTVAERIDIDIRDAFTGELPPAGIYLMGSLLHNLDDASASTIIAKCHDGARRGSILIVVERNFRPDILRDSSRDLDMRILFGGRERSTSEVCKLLASSGYEIASVRRTHDYYRIITGQKR